MILISAVEMRIDSTIDWCRFQNRFFKPNEVQFYLDASATNCRTFDRAWLEGDSSEVDSLTREITIVRN
jgi:hypothetical protein